MHLFQQALARLYRSTDRTRSRQWLDRWSSCGGPGPLLERLHDGIRRARAIRAGIPASAVGRRVSLGGRLRAPAAFVEWGVSWFHGLVNRHRGTQEGGGGTAGEP